MRSWRASAPPPPSHHSLFPHCRACATTPPLSSVTIWLGTLALLSLTITTYDDIFTTYIVHRQKGHTMALAEVAEVLGGEHVLRQPLHNRWDLIALSRKGVPKATLVHLAH